MPRSDSLLEKFCNRVESLCGMQVCIYDFGYFTLENNQLELPYIRREHCSAYCRLVKSNPEAYARCVANESYRARESCKRGVFVHRCYAGLTDLIVPIRVGSRQVGAIFVGQCAPAGAAEQRRYAGRMARQYALDVQALGAALAEAKPLNTRELLELEDIALFTAEYIRQVLGSTITSSLLDSHIAFDRNGRILMRKVPNYFLDQLSMGAGVIRKAIAYLRGRYWESVSQSDVARHVGLSESHFSRQFRKATGMTYKRCIAEARMSAAVWLLKKTDLKIKEIASLLNYGESSSLLRAIRKYTGTSTTDLRGRQPMPWQMNRLDLMPPAKGAQR